MCANRKDQTGSGCWSPHPETALANSPRARESLFHSSDALTAKFFCVCDAALQITVSHYSIVAML